MPDFILSILAVMRVFFRSRGDTALEVLALRQQVAVLKRKRPRPALNSLDHFFWVALRRFWSRWTDVLVIVKPETVVGWHRTGFRLYWRWRSRPRDSRQKITAEIRVLIRRLAEENPDWGAPRIHGELQILGFVVSERSVARYLRRIRRRGDPGKQNGIAERWVAGCRREMLEHLIPLNEQHLRRLVRDYVSYFHKDRIHDSLGKDTPNRRPIGQKPSSRATVASNPRLGGLHHRCLWREAA